MEIVELTVTRQFHGEAEGEPGTTGAANDGNVQRTVTIAPPTFDDDAIRAFVDDTIERFGPILDRLGDE